MKYLSLIMGLLCAAISLGAHAWPSTCHQDDYDKRPLTQKFRSVTAHTQSLPSRRQASIQSQKSKSTLSNRIRHRSGDLTGSITGDWEFVTGWVGFPYHYQDQDFYALVRGFDGTRQSGDEYSFSGWDGKVFWIDMGDGIPHLLASQLVTDNFTPPDDDVFTQSGKLYDAGFVLYRQAGMEYSSADWEEQAAWSHLLYVTDENDQLLEVIVDVYDDNDEYLGSTIPEAGDQLQMRTHAYNLNSPDEVWMLEYMDFKTLTKPVSIEKAHYIPEVDYNDSDLLTRAGGQFKTHELKLVLLLDAGRPDRLNSAEYKFAFNIPQPLGYTWGEARQKFSSDSTTSIPEVSMASTGGGGTFDWILLLLGGIGSYRIVTRRKLS